MARLVSLVQRCAGQRTKAVNRQVLAAADQPVEIQRAQAELTPVPVQLRQKLVGRLIRPDACQQVSR